MLGHVCLGFTVDKTPRLLVDGGFEKTGIVPIVADARAKRRGMFFFSSRRRNTRCISDWSSDVCSSDLPLFNDTALGQAPPTAWVLARAAELDGGTPPAADPRGAPSAGVHRLVGVRSVVLFDAGERSEERRVGKEGRSRGSPYH